MDKRSSNYLGDDLGGRASPGGRLSPGGRGRVSLANVMAGNRISRQSPGLSGRGSFSRAGTIQSGRDTYSAPGDAHSVLLNSPDNIEKERKYAQLHLALQREFAEADINKDGRLRKDELVQFLMNKSGADTVHDENELEMLKERYTFLADILFQ